jgi:TRAP-type C4-dicarboxylate transport system substrate-binding protein
MWADRTRRGTAVTLVAGLALVAGGCGGSGSGSDKAGGAEPREPRVLTFAEPNGATPDQLVSLAEEVNEGSEGTLEIEFESAWRLGEADYESATIDDVRAGKVDMAWVGARAFDTVGVNTFQPLVAPLLIDSHDLQAAVFEAGIPDQMLAGLKDLDLVGVGVLPGPMRKVLGVSKPFVRPADFAGEVVGLQDSAVATEALIALGATPRPVPVSADLDGLDGYEQQLDSIVSNHYSTEAGYVTTNLNLWSRPLVIVMGTDAYESLAPDQRDGLREAAAAAIPAALDDSRAEDDEGITALCREGMTLATASDTDLAELRTAVEPVYEELSADPTTSAHLDAIVDLKAEIDAGPEARACPDEAAAAPTGSEFPEGTFEMTLTEEEAADDCLPGERKNDEILFELTLDSGSLQQFVEYGGRGGEREAGFVGTYEVFRDRVEISDSLGTFTAHWTFDGTNLTFSDLEGGRCDDVIVWTTHPWALVIPAGAPGG